MRDFPGTYNRILLVHAHPDDEALTTGVLCRWLVDNDRSVELVTCTRGEKGEIVEGSIPLGTSPADLAIARMREWESATAKLGVASRVFLGEPPALAYPPARRYRDSGMSWVTSTQAGPAKDASSDSFSVVDAKKPADDLVALVERWQPDVLISYDDAGGYGHPDHVRARDIAIIAAQRTHTPVLEIVDVGQREHSYDTGGKDIDSHHGDEAAGRATNGYIGFDYPQALPVVIEALQAYRTQLTVTAEGVITHVGGQHEILSPRVLLREVDID